MDTQGDEAYKLYRYPLRIRTHMKMKATCSQLDRRDKHKDGSGINTREVHKQLQEHTYRSMATAIKGNGEQQILAFDIPSHTWDLMFAHILSTHVRTRDGICMPFHMQQRLSCPFEGATQRHLPQSCSFRTIQ